MKKLLALLLPLFIAAILVRAEDPQLPDESGKEGDLIRSVALQRHDNIVLTLDLNDVDSITVDQLREKIKSFPGLADNEQLDALIDDIQRQFGDTLENKFRHIQVSGAIADPKRYPISLITVWELRSSFSDAEMLNAMNELNENETLHMAVEPIDLGEGMNAFKATAEIPPEAAGIPLENIPNELINVRLKNPRFLVSGTAKAVTKMVKNLYDENPKPGNPELASLLAQTHRKDYPLAMAFALQESRTRTSLQPMIERIGASDAQLGNVVNNCKGFTLQFNIPEKNALGIYCGLVFDKPEDAGLAKAAIFDAMVLGLGRYAMLQFTDNQPLPLFDSMVSTVTDKIAELTFKLTNEDIDIIKPFIPNQIPTIQDND